MTIYFTHNWLNKKHIKYATDGTDCMSFLKAQINWICFAMYIVLVITNYINMTTICCWTWEVIVSVVPPLVHATCLLPSQISNSSNKIMEQTPPISFSSTFIPCVGYFTSTGMGIR